MIKIYVWDDGTWCYPDEWQDFVNVTDGSYTIITAQEGYEDATVEEWLLSK